MRRIVHYYPGAMGDSGVTFALWSWARAQAASGAEVQVLHAPRAQVPPIDAPATVPFVSKTCAPGLTTRSIPHRGRHRLTLRPEQFDRHLSQRDLLVLHAGWVPSNLVAAAAARRARVPYLVVPHGVYERSWTGYLKGPRVVRDHFERCFLERAAAVHVFFDSESHDIKALAPRAQYMAVPTGFELPAERWTGGGGYLGWIGRVDPVHKGLDTLLRAIARLAPGERPTVRIRGYDYKGGIRRLQALVGELDLGRWIRLDAAVAGNAKTRFLLDADGYVHPSRWESHSMALLENLALGVPCLVSKAIHIAPTLESSGAAVLSAPREADLAAAFAPLAVQRPLVGARGRELVRDRFNWLALMRQFHAELGYRGLD